MASQYPEMRSMGDRKSVPLRRVFLALAVLAMSSAGSIAIAATHAHASAPDPGTTVPPITQAVDPPEELLEPAPPEEEPAPEHIGEWNMQLGPWQSRYDEAAIETAKQVAREARAAEEGAGSSDEPPAAGRMPHAPVLAVASSGAALTFLAVGRRKQHGIASRTSTPTKRRSIR